MSRNFESFGVLLRKYFHIPLVHPISFNLCEVKGKAESSGRLKSVMELAFMIINLPNEDKLYPRNVQPSSPD